MFRTTIFHFCNKNKRENGQSAFNFLSMSLEEEIVRIESGFRKLNSFRTELLYNPAGIGCKEVCMLKEAYSMNTLLVPTEHTVTVKETKSADNTCMESDQIQNGEVNYEHEGYQVRVHFKGNKTLMQCIQNLIERRIGS